jgi:hypothetical protein
VLDESGAGDRVSGADHVRVHAEDVGEPGGVLAAEATDSPELRLITCGGAFDTATRSYRDNVVVYARLVAAERARPSTPDRSAPARMRVGSHSRVSTRVPSPVMATVCSMCAARLPSQVRSAQPSAAVR